MSLKDFTARCSAITLITASAFGIAQASEPTHLDAEQAGIQASTTDNAITARVKNALQANRVGQLGIQTELGVVTLTGTVANEELRQKAVQVALAVAGVHGVDTALLKIERIV